jgi:hypothetical protein
MSHDWLEYKGANLLGLTLDNARAILGMEDATAANMGPWDAVYYYYYQLGLTLCIWDGVVQTATCEASCQTGP